MEIIPAKGFPHVHHFTRFNGEAATLTKVDNQSVSSEDIARIVEICNQPVVKQRVTYQYSTGEAGEYTENDAHTFLEFAEKSWAENAPTYLIRNRHGEIVGNIGIRPPEDDCAEIGYWSDTKDGSGGYMTNAVTELCNLASQQGIKEIEGNVALDNEKSAAVLTRAGFVSSGQKNHTDTHGQTLQVQVFTKQLA